MDEFTNKMRAERMSAPGKEAEITRSGDSAKVAAPSFADAGDFLRGGGKCDGEMENIGDVGSIPKGTPSPGVPKLEKGAPGPQGPGVI